MRAVLVFVILLCSAGVLFFAQQILQYEMSGPVQRLNYLWARDMENLKQSSIWHPGLDRLNEFELYSDSSETKGWLTRLELPFETQLRGTHTLEVLVLTFEDEGMKYAMIQMDLVEKNSENMVWELARTYNLSSKTRILNRDLESGLDAAKDLLEGLDYEPGPSVEPESNSQTDAREPEVPQ